MPQDVALQQPLAFSSIGAVHTLSTSRLEYSTSIPVPITSTTTTRPTKSVERSFSASLVDGINTKVDKSERLTEVFIGYSTVPSSLAPVVREAWEEVNYNSVDFDADAETLQDIPDYVLEYAPLVHLFSGEKYWPSDIAEHLQHVTPTFNYTPIQQVTQRPTLTNLDQYNEFENARWVFLTSKDDPETYPEWLGSQKNIPQPVDTDGTKAEDDDHSDSTYAHSLKLALAKLKARITHQSALDHGEGEPVQGGRSSAPAVLITVRKPGGILDAFWFYFYSFNQGNTVFNVRFGNHVGDWEHSCIRFHHGKPQAVYYSEHNFGSAYSYKAVEKYGKRPVVYSATGTHANYATPGGHPYVLPWGILHDQTDQGPLWDPTLNAHTYTYDYVNHTISASTLTPDAPTQWFDFAGHWGDRTYPLDDKRQYKLFGQYHYVSGPLGPKFKNLGRKKVCGGSDTTPCVIKRWLRQEEIFGRDMPRNDRLDTSG